MNSMRAPAATRTASEHAARRALAPSCVTGAKALPIPMAFGRSKTVARAAAAGTESAVADPASKYYDAIVLQGAHAVPLHELCS